MAAERNEPVKIYAQMSKVMNEVGAIAKTGKNEDDDYTFRKIDDVYNALQPVLAKNGVFFVPSVIDSSEERVGKGKAAQLRVKLKVKYQIYADDGSAIEAIVYGEAIDSSDKAHNKALTAAFKYLLIQVFCIAVAEIEDADKISPSLAFVKEKPRQTKPSNDLEIRDGIYRGKMASKVSRKELEAYVKSMDDVVNEAGKTHPKWFIELKKWMK